MCIAQSKTFVNESRGLCNTGQIARSVGRGCCRGRAPVSLLTGDVVGGMYCAIHRNRDAAKRREVALRAGRGGSSTFVNEMNRGGGF